MDPLSLPYFIGAALLFCALVGASIGDRANRMGTGALLGLALGPLGWAFTALIVEINGLRE